MKKIFYNEHHKRDRITGRIIKRDYSTYKAVECSLCKNPIKGNPSFKYRGRLVIKDINKVNKMLNPHSDVNFSKLDYCEDCHIRLETSRIKLHNKFR